MDVAKRLRPITMDEVVSDYERLKSESCESRLTFSRAGLGALDKFFFHKRLAAKTKRHISFLNALKDKKTWNYVSAKTQKIKKLGPKNLKGSDELLRKEYSVFQLYYGTINQFRPVAARWLYCKLGARHGILDFSAGWGGRCLAAMSLGIPYRGIDANRGLAGSYKKLIGLEPGCDVRMFFEPAEKVIKKVADWKYDLIFTSPPYFMLEEYEKMPAYGSKEGFLEKFFVPVVLAAWNGLMKGGHMALNMPADMYKAIKDIIPVKASRLVLKLQDRHAAAAVAASVGKAPIKGSASKEYIYVWLKS
jgi:hypothetical protein